jgi:hypothetical protein
VTRATWRSRPEPAEAFAWLAVVFLIGYVLAVTYHWRIPDPGGTSFGPVWAVISLVGVVLARVVRGRWEPVVVLAVGAAVGSLLTDLVQFQGQLLRDLAIYLRAGEHFATGAPVYLSTILTEIPVDRTTYPYLYPPPTLPVLAVLAALPRPLVEAGWLVGSAAVAVGGLRLLGLSPRWALAALVWTPLFQGLYVGNVAVPAFGIFALAPWFGAGLILAAVFKPYSGLAALWLIRERRFRPVVVGLVVLAGLALATLPLVGVDAWRDWIEGLRLYAMSQAGLPALVAIGLGAYLPGPLALVAAGAAVGWAWLARGRVGLARFGIATVVASPSLFTHGFLVALPAFLGLQPVALWLALGITSVAPGLGWWLAVVLVVAASLITSLERSSGGPWPSARGIE